MIPRAKRRPLDPTSWKKLGMVTGQVWHIHGENVMVVDVDVDGVTSQPTGWAPFAWVARCSQL